MRHLHTLAALWTIAFSTPALAQQWVKRANMNHARQEHVIAELADNKPVHVLGDSKGAGRVLVASGRASSSWAEIPMTSVEIYDPATGWTPAAPLPMQDLFVWYTSLSDGRVLVAGGAAYGEPTQLLADFNLRSFVYDPATDVWIETGPLPANAINPHSFIQMVSIDPRHYLLAGGVRGDARADDPTRAKHMVSQRGLVFTYDRVNPAASTWDFTRDVADGSVTEMTTRHTTGKLVKLRDGGVLFIGGYTQANDNESSFVDTGLDAGAEVEYYDPATGRWSARAPLPHIPGEDDFDNGGRWAPHVVLLNDGRVLIAGGVGNVEVRSSAVVYDPATDSYERVGDLAFRHVYGFWSANLKNDGVLIAGWSLDPTYSFAETVSEIYDPATKVFHRVLTDFVPQIDSFGSPMVTLKSGVPFVAGGLHFGVPGVEDYATASEQTVVFVARPR